MTQREVTSWATYISTENGLRRLVGLVPEFEGKQTRSHAKPYFDTDLYMVHTLMLASSVQLHLDNCVNMKLSVAAKKLVELVSYLDGDDYQYLDPVLAVRINSA